MLRPKEKKTRARATEKPPALKAWIRKDLKKALAQDKEILEALD